MSLTLPQIVQYLEDAQRSYVDRGLTVIRASKKGSRSFGSFLTQGLLTADMLRASSAYVPAGTIVTPATTGTAVFDLSTVVSSTVPNCNDVRVTLIRLDSPPITILDTRIDKQGLTDEQWVAAIASTLNLLAGDYTGSNTGTSLNVAVDEGNTDSGDLQLSVYDYAAPDLPIYYQYFDWNTLSPGSNPIFIGGALNSTGKTYLMAYLSGASNTIVIDDGLGAGLSSQIFTAALGIPSRLQKFSLNSSLVYWTSTPEGQIYSTDIGIPATVARGTAVVTGSNKVDSIFSPTTNFIYFICGGKYSKINISNTVTNSTAIAMPDDDLLTLNVLTGIPLSYSAGGTVMTQFADSGALTTHTLTITIAGRVGTYNNNYYVPRQSQRQIYIVDSTFTATTFINLASFPMSVTSNVQHVYCFNEFMLVIHTDNNVSVFDLNDGSFLSTFFAGINAITFFFDATLGMFMMNDTGVYQISITDGVVQVQPFQNGTPAIVWTDADNCLTEAQQIKLMGKVQREWNTSGCNSTSGFTGGSSPIGGSATLIQTSAGQDLLTSNSLYVIE